VPGSKRKVGILGAGYIADWHLKALRAVRGAHAVAVCDQNLERAQSVAQRYGLAEVYPDIDSMLAAGRLDAVHVLLPPDRHFSAADQLLRAGVHVFLEKPACTNPLDCVRLSELAASKGRSIGVGHNFLFASVYERLRDDVRAGLLGPLSEVSIIWHKELAPLRSGPFGAWMLREPGNLMLEIGPHSIGHLLDLVGEPDTLAVETDRPVELPNSTRLPRRWWVRGTRGETQFDLHFNLGVGYPEHRIHVRGLAGSATADFEAGTYVLRRPGGGMEDLARYRLTKRESRQLNRQARGKLSRYILSNSSCRGGGRTSP
jgi:predicted dehydrogenase